jgi:lysophospholipase L1-like esterase
VLWERTLPTESVPYDFSSPAPDVVLINLGTNDFAPEVSDFSPFEASYDAFVERVRDRYPEAHVFVMMGPLLTDGYPEGRQAYTKARAALTALVDMRVARGDSKLHFFEVERATPEEGFGCDWHPSAKTHERMAVTVARELKEKVGFWETFSSFSFDFCAVALKSSADFG